MGVFNNNRVVVNITISLILLAVLAANPTIASSQDTGAAKIWSHVFGMNIDSIALSPNLRYIAVGTFTIYLIDWLTNKTVFTDYFPGGTDSISWSPDSKYVLYTEGGYDGHVNTDEAGKYRTIKIYAVNGTLILSKLIDGYVWASSWSVNNLIALGTGSNTLEVYKFNNGSLVKYWSVYFPANVLSVEWSPDGRYVALVSSTTVYVYSYRGSLVCSEMFTDMQKSVAWSPDGRYIAVGGNDDVLKILSASSCSIIDSYTVLGDINSIDWENKYVYTGLHNGFVEIFRFSDRSLTHIAELHPISGYIDIYGLDANSKYLAVSSWNGSLFILDVSGLIRSDVEEPVVTKTQTLYYYLTRTYTKTYTETQTVWVTSTKTLTSTITYTPTRYTTILSTKYNTVTTTSTRTLTTTTLETINKTNVITSTIKYTVTQTKTTTTTRTLSTNTTTLTTITKTALSISVHENMLVKEILLIVNIATPLALIILAYIRYVRK